MARARAGRTMRRTLRNAPWLRARVAIVTAPLAVAIGHSAHAADRVYPPAQAAPVSPDSPATSAGSGPRLGALAGVGFPRPLAVEGLVLLGDKIALGVELAALPPIGVAGGTSLGTMPALIRGQPATQVSMDSVRVDLWSVAADCRWFPFGGAFYVGLRAGRQHVEGMTTIHMTHLGATPETLAVDEWFVNPGVGLLWKPRGGLAFGMEAGLQIPLAPRLSSTLPLALDPVVRSKAYQLGGSVIPTVDLVRLGMVL
jgi:hypothetical protein